MDHLLSREYKRRVRGSHASETQSYGVRIALHEWSNPILSSRIESEQVPFLSLSERHRTVKKSAGEAAFLLAPALPNNQYFVTVWKLDRLFGRLAQVVRARH